MASPRCAAGTSFTRAPSIRMSPSLAVSRPQIMRSRVDLPQPDGPTKTMNSPFSKARSTPWITVASRYRLTTLRSSKLAIELALFDAGGSNALRDVALQQGEDDRHRQQGQHCHRKQIIPGR